MLPQIKVRRPIGKIMRSSVWKHCFVGAAGNIGHSVVSGSRRNARQRHEEGLWSIEIAVLGIALTLRSTGPATAPFGRLRGPVNSALANFVSVLEATK